MDCIPKGTSFKYLTRNSSLDTIAGCDTKIDINYLPHEIINHILSFLPIEERTVYERVCRDWQYILNINNDIKDFKGILKEILNPIPEKIKSIIPFQHVKIIANIKNDSPIGICKLKCMIQKRLRYKNIKVEIEYICYGKYIIKLMYKNRKQGIYNPSTLSHKKNKYTELLQYNLSNQPYKRTKLYGQVWQ